MGQINQYEKTYHDSINKRIPRAKAIRLHCLDCCSYQANEVKLCAVKDCVLWRYRMGYEEKDALYYEYKSNNASNDEIIDV